MRDRLIKLIKNLGKSQMPMVDGLELWADAIADHLLANGVIVPPVNVGQTVYIIDEGDGECAEDYVLGVEVKQIFINKHGIGLDLPLNL